MLVDAGCPSDFQLALSERGAPRLVHVSFVKDLRGLSLVVKLLPLASPSTAWMVLCLFWRHQPHAHSVHHRFRCVLAAT